MKVNGEIKALWGMTVIAFLYAIYMICTPDPEDGQLLLAVITPVVVIVTGVATKAIVQRRILLGK